jgi:hypothetical protein
LIAFTAKLAAVVRCVAYLLLLIYGAPDQRLALSRNKKWDFDNFPPAAPTLH